MQELPCGSDNQRRIMKYIFLFAAMFSSTMALSQGQDVLTKKEQKFASGIFGGEPLAERLNTPERVYLMKKQGSRIGYLMSTSAKGKYEYFDYAIAYASDFKVLGLSILVYRSSHGAAISQKGWLSQFKGYSGEKLTLGKDVDAIAGATISAAALLKDLERTYKLMNQLKTEGIIK